MTQAAERLREWWEKAGSPRSPLSDAFGDLPYEEIVKVVLNSEHRPFSTMEERLAVALRMELGMAATDDLDPSWLFLMRCIIARMGLEHVSGQIYRAHEAVGSLLGSGGWLIRMNRKLSQEEWDIYSLHSDGSFDQEKGEYSAERAQDLIKKLFPDIEIVETIRKELP